MKTTKKSWMRAIEKSILKEFYNEDRKKLTTVNSIEPDFIKRLEKLIEYHNLN